LSLTSTLVRGWLLVWGLALGLVASTQDRAVVFLDASSGAGISARTICGGPEKLSILEVNGSGCAWLDYNNDGWVDLYIVNGSTIGNLKSPPTAPERPRNYLFKNLKNGKFQDVALEAGVPGSGWGMGCAAADYDNDGFTDLLVTTFGPNILYRNNGDGTFSDVTENAGVAGGDIWHTGAAFGDYDNDGLLDLYITGYIDFDIVHPPTAPRQYCRYRGLDVFCGPRGLPGAPDALYRNNGDGTFSDVTRKARIEDRNLYYGFTAVFEDFDDDGRADIFVANDACPNYLYRNRGDGTFEEVGLSAGVAYDSEGRRQSNMGVAVGDYDRNGTMDIFITEFAQDHYTLFRNLGRGQFADVSLEAGIRQVTHSYLGWGVLFLDYNNDGLLDVLTANGHIYPQVDRFFKDEQYRQRLLLFENNGKGQFSEVGVERGFGQLPIKSSRAAAAADFDNDGDLDAAITNIDETTLLLENRGGNRNHWLTVKTIGRRSNRDGVGARIRLAAGGAVQFGRVRRGESFLSQNDGRVHFGLGAATRVERLEIQWPSGTRDIVEGLAADQHVSIVEGEGVTRAPRTELK